MSTFTNLSFTQLAKGEKHVDICVPKVDEEHQGMKSDGQNEADDWNQLFSVKYLAAEVVVY